MPSPPHRVAAPGAVVVGLAAALLIHRGAPDPSADVLRGTEEAFARGLHPRELPPRGVPLRWTGERAWLGFRFLPRGPATLEVEVRGHRAPVAVAADGVIVGVLDTGAGFGRFALPDNGRRSRDVELRASPFQAGDGRRLGTQLRRVTLRTGPRGAPPPLLAFLFIAAALCSFATAAAAGWRVGAAFAVSVGATAALLLALWPAGLVRSTYTPVAATIVTAGGAFALAFVRWAARRWPDVGPAGYAGLLLAVLVQGLAATSPVMVVSDAVFHANNLARVAAGDLWLTSFTQHTPPFRFPYGVSFYALLAPLYWLGLDPVWLVRAGAAVSGLLASGALLALLAPRGDRCAGLAVAALQLLPVTFDLYSYGNLSNVFGQALTAVFFTWWAAGGPGGWSCGALLLATAALGHFSSFVVAGMVCTALLIAWRRELRAHRWRTASVGVGVGVAVLYYAQFAPLVIAQLPRLWEGASAGPAGAASGGGLAPLLSIAGQWGLPVIGLALAGPPRPREGPLDRDLAAYWGAGLALALVAAVTPLDVRYLHALGLALAVAAATGTLRLWSRGMLGRIAVVALWLAQALLAGRNLFEAVLWRYRP
jgi:hypothetical protein